MKKFKDSEGRIKRQAARFQIYVYDEESPEGRPLEIGASVKGGGNHGTLINIQWRVYLANKKAAWYEFAAACRRTRVPGRASAAQQGYHRMPMRASGS